jgi:hypothetical protein
LARPPSTARSSGPSQASSSAEKDSSASPGGPLPPRSPNRPKFLLRIIPIAVVLGISLFLGILNPSDPSLYDLEVGDCFNDETDYTDPDVEVESVVRVECTESHLYEFVGTYNSTLLWSSSTYPTDSAMAAEAFQACGRLLENYSGMPYGEAFLDVIWYTPLPADWDSGQSNSVLCAAYTIDAVTESVENQAGNRPLGCFTWEDEFIDCSVAQGFEQYVFAWHPASNQDPFPGQEAIDAWVEDICETHFVSYVGAPVEETPYDAWWIGPDESTWAEPDRLMQCFVNSLSGEDLTGTVYQRG